ncbi:PLP-dependent transferase [Comamonas sp. NLF-1-9]|uniref:PLP-dependent transferase n=1 Tax=Comamonas sp. NLF-1-9 TaxID=2853163 RepID=UPI001C470494|nr:PLP-dependent transferase [Comamonas sp. NLF-1-9]QXL85321.1 PLP-dependent transferase [Comamonas sp. NLF-1-9]
MPDTTRFDIATRLIHDSYRPPAGFESVQPPVYKASTVLFADTAALRASRWEDRSGYTYGLHGTPASYLLEQRIAALEGASHCLLAPSGLAAISVTALALLGQGDEVLLPHNVYGPNKALSVDLLQRYGIGCGFYDPMDAQDLAARMGPATRLVWLEPPGSVTMEFPDLPALVRVCRGRGVTTALDNTWGAGLAFAPFDLLGDASLGVDVSVHALTKYPSGGGDLLMGAISTRSRALHERIQRCHMHLGMGVAGNDVEAVLRALPGMALRYRAQDRAARELAGWLQGQGAVAQVLHPALAGSPGHAHWQLLCARGGEGLAAGIFSVVIDARYTSAQVDAFCDALQHFRLGYSWGGPLSLVMPYQLAAMRAATPTQLAPGTVVRFAIGLEGVEDLRADLAQAMERVFGI